MARLQPVAYWFSLIVVDLDPVTVRVLQVDLFHAINAGGNCFVLALPVGVGELLFFETLYEFFNGWYAEAEVGAFGRYDDGVAVFDEVEVAMGGDTEPGVFAVVKGLRNGIQLDDLAVEGGAFGQVPDR